MKFCVDSGRSFPDPDGQSAREYNSLSVRGHRTGMFSLLVDTINHDLRALLRIRVSISAVVIRRKKDKAKMRQCRHFDRNWITDIHRAEGSA